MNICIFSLYAHFNNTGGYTTHKRMLCNLLLKLGHNITIICSSHPKIPNVEYEFVYEKKKYICVPRVLNNLSTPQWIKGSRTSFIKAHKQKPFDVVFSEGIASRGIIKEAAIYNIPSCCFVHNFGITHFYNISKEINNYRALLYYLFITIPRIIFSIFTSEIPLYHSCSKVVSVSLHNAERIKKYYKIPKEKIKTIHNWVDTSKLRPDNELKEKGRVKWNLPKNKLIFLTVGTLYYPKGFHVAIRSFKELLKSHADACLLIVGDGDSRYEKHLKDLARNVNVKFGETIQLLGEIRPSDLPFIYNASDIFLMPSLLIEGMAYTLIEAMACGLPFIATRLGGNVETAGNTGILVSPGDAKVMANAMIDLAEYPQKRKNLGNLSRKRVEENFSEKVAYKKVTELLNSLQ